MCRLRHKDERARFYFSFPPNHYHRPPFPGIGCFSLAHDFAHFQPHSPLNLLCEQRIHASTLSRFNTVAAFHSPQYIIQRECALLCAFFRSVLVVFLHKPLMGYPFSQAGGFDALASCARVLALALQSIPRQSPCISVLLLTDHPSLFHSVKTCPAWPDL